MEKIKTNLIHDYDELIGKNYPLGIYTIVGKELIPQTIDDFIGYALLAIESKNKHENNFWFKKHRNFGTIDALIHYKDELIVLPKSPLLYNIKIDSKLNDNGNLNFSLDDFEKLKKTHDLINRENISTGPLTKKEALDHLILQRLFRVNSLKEYIELRYDEKSEDPCKISVHLPNYQETPGINAFSIGFLDDWTHISAQSRLDDADWHIIGVNEQNLNQLYTVILKKYDIKNLEELEKILAFYKENKK